MKYNTLRKLGKFGAEVAPIGIGAMSFTNFYGFIYRSSNDWIYLFNY